MPEIMVKNGFIFIKNISTHELKKFKSTDLAIKLGWSYIGWHGTPIKNMLTTNELRNFEVNQDVYGSLRLEEFIGCEKSVELNEEDQFMEENVQLNELTCPQ
ncbi:hypothetical protein COOONC_06971 [Cooperia oncophora]